MGPHVFILMGMSDAVKSGRPHGELEWGCDGVEKQWEFKATGRAGLGVGMHPRLYVKS